MYSLEEIEQKIIDLIFQTDENPIPKAFLSDFFQSTLFDNENVLTEGLTAEDFDIIISTSNAIGKEILHTMIICDTKYDPNTKFCQLIKDEDVEYTITKYKELHEKTKILFPSFKFMLTPRIRRNLRFNITLLEYYTIDNGRPIVYKMDHHDVKKDILCLVSFKLKLTESKNKKHKFGKITQILEQLEEKIDNPLLEFWNYYKVIYIIFCIQDQQKMIEEYQNFPDSMKAKYKNIKIIFYLDQQNNNKESIKNEEADEGETIEKEKAINKEENENIKLINMFNFNSYGKNYYFLMDSEYKIYKSDNMLFSGDIIEEAIKRKKREKEDSKKDKALLLYQRYTKFIELYQFYRNLEKYKYAMYFNLEFEICLNYNPDSFKFNINYIDFYNISADLRKKEYLKIIDIVKILEPDAEEDIREIEVVDLQIDFTNNMCLICQKKIPDDKPMYHCYKCNQTYCHECVMKNYNDVEKKGKKKFIDSKHNLLFFKTRNINNFKSIDKFKLGNDIFVNEKDDQLENCKNLCYGCKRKFDDSPRYICLNCNPCTLIYGRFHDYCVKCIEHMMNGDEEGKKIQEIEERLYGFETKILIENNETYTHNNDEHVYIMVALEVREQNEY